MSVIILTFLIALGSVGLVWTLLQLEDEDLFDDAFGDIPNTPNEIRPDRGGGDDPGVSHNGEL